MSVKLITSESVSSGSPDRLANIICDAILDACLAQDPNSRTSIECALKGEICYIFGEISTTASINIEHIVKSTLIRTGYNDPRWLFHPAKISIMQNLTEQAPEAIQITKDNPKKADDQGVFFGYAVNNGIDESRLGAAHRLAQNLMTAYDLERANNSALGPHAKCQVTMRYDNGAPTTIDSVVLTYLHDADMKIEDVRDYGIDFIESNLGAFETFASSGTKLFINSGGTWTVGGPYAKSGISGRKIIVDTYGGYARNGGDALSGKSPDKIGRTAQYIARNLALNALRYFKINEVELQLAYLPGSEYPASMFINDLPTFQIAKFLNSVNIPLSGGEFVDAFRLKTPIYTATSCFGNFGHEHFPWEKIGERN